MARYRRIRRDRRDETIRRRARSAATQSTRGVDEASQDSVQRYGLPAHSTTRSLRQAAVLDMQRRYGNAAVQRYLASSNQQSVQRQPQPEKTRAEAALGSRELKFKGELSLDSDGGLNLELGPALDLKQFGLSATASIEPTSLKGVGEMRLGDKKNYLAPKVIISPSGKATFVLGHEFSKDLFSLSSTLETDKDKTTLGHTLGWTNPFGAERFDVTASLRYKLNAPEVASAELAAQYKLLGNAKDKGTPYLVLRLEGSYTSAGPDSGKRSEAKGMLFLVGRF